MKKMQAGSGWLLLLAQLPASPSSIRVALWRRLRAAGAASVVNGAWVLPRSNENASLFNDLAEIVHTHGGNAIVLSAGVLNAKQRQELILKFRSDRAGEYAEFQERTRSFLAEVKRETERRKFTFAELEELEDDLAKLRTWLAKIRDRDFFPAGDSKKAGAALAACQKAFQAFSREVYRRDARALSAERGDGR